MTDKQIIKTQQAALSRTESALTESRALIMAALADLRLGGGIAAKAKLENYAKTVIGASV